MCVYPLLHASLPALVLWPLQGPIKNQSGGMYSEMAQYVQELLLSHTAWS